MSNTNDDIIQQLVTEFNTLQSEYNTKLALYVSTKENYLQELQKTNVDNKCVSYSLLGTSTNISQECYSQIWKDQKCTTTPVPDVDKTKTFMQLLTDVFNISKSTTASDKTACYGTAPATGTDTRIFNTATQALANGHDADYSTTANYIWDKADASVTTTQSLETPTSVNNCLQLCAKTAGCTGATYEIGKAATATTSAISAKCTFVNGPGKLVATTVTTPPTKTAIYLKLDNYSNQLKILNDELLAIMTSLETKRVTIQAKLDLVNVDLSSLEVPFKSDYDDLLAEKTILTNLLNKHRDIEAKYKQEQNMAHDEKTRLRFWSIIAVIIVLFIIKQFFGFDSPSINAVFWITIFLILGLSLSSPSGFAAMGILFLVFLILIINNVF